MNTLYKQFICICVSVLSASTLFSQDNQKIVNAIKSEVDRNMSGLRIENLPPPSFISYTIMDNDYLNIFASGGSLVNSSTYKQRVGIPFVLVGDFEKNNANFLTISDFYSYPDNVPIDNTPGGIATSVWSALDSKYKSAAENFESKKATLKQQKLAEEEENVSDYEQTTPPNLLLAPAKMNLDKSYWEEYAKKGSEVFNKYPEITSSQVDISHRNTTAYYYDTENGKFIVPYPYYKIHIQLTALAGDGQEVSDDWYIEHTDFSSIPDLKSFVAECETYATYFLELKKAPMIKESYSGPVLFEELAVAEAMYGMFFSNNALIAKKKPVVSPDASRYFGNNQDTKGNDLEMMMNKKIISRSLNIQSLSGMDTYNGVRMDGYIPIDLQGVIPDKELFLVEKGVLKCMLNGRTPTPAIPHSNGHARFDFFRMKLRIAPGNIRFFGSNDVYSGNELKQKLIAAAKEEDYNYAYIVRRMRNYNNTFALYRINVNDGREELLRGASFTDLNMKSFKRVLGVSKEEYITTNAASGQPATLIVPQFVLFEELEITKNNNLSLKTPYVVPQPNTTVSGK